MLHLETRHLVLREITLQDLDVLYQFRNNEHFVHNCTYRDRVQSKETFEEEMRSDFATDRHLQVLINPKVSGITIGTIYSYSFSSIDEHLFLSTFVLPEFWHKMIVVEALATFTMFLLKEFDLFKIYFDVYEQNTKMLSVLNKDWFKHEGTFVGHRKRGGERISVRRFAMYRDAIPRLEKLQHRFNRS